MEAWALEFFKEPDIGRLAVFAAMFSVSALYAFVLFRFVTDKKYRSHIFNVGNGILRSTAWVVSSFFGARVTFEDHSTRRDEYFLESLREEIARGGIKLAEASEAEVVGYFRTAINSELKEKIGSELRDLLNREVLDSVLNEVDVNLSRARRRLEAAASAVSIRGVFSLLFGIASAIGAFYILYSVISIVDVVAIETLSMKTMFYIAIGRLSVVIFVTFIAYFFLSLYRRSLDEIQYYQSELTNIDVWISSILTARFSKNEQLLVFVTAKLLSIDRTLNLRSRQPDRTDGGDVKISDELLQKIIDKIPLGS